MGKRILLRNLVWFIWFWTDPAFMNNGTRICGSLHIIEYQVYAWIQELLHARVSEVRRFGDVSAAGAGRAAARAGRTPAAARLTVGTICCAPSAVEAPRPRPPWTSPVNKSLRAGYERSWLDLSEISPMLAPLTWRGLSVTEVYVWQWQRDKSGVNGPSATHGL